MKDIQSGEIFLDHPVDRFVLSNGVAYWRQREQPTAVACSDSI